METQDQHADIHAKNSPGTAGTDPEPMHSLPQRETVGVGRNRALGILVLVAVAALGVALSQLSRFGDDAMPVGVHRYAKGDNSHSIHLALEAEAGKITGAGVMALVFARTAVDVSFETWTIRLSDGRGVPLPRTDDIVLVDDEGHLSTLPFRQNLLLRPILRNLDDMPFERLRSEFARLHPATAEFWRD